MAAAGLAAMMVLTAVPVPKAEFTLAVSTTVLGLVIADGAPGAFHTEAFGVTRVRAVNIDRVTLATDSMGRPVSGGTILLEPTAGANAALVAVPRLGLSPRASLMLSWDGRLERYRLLVAPIDDSIETVLLPGTEIRLGASSNAPVVQAGAEGPVPTLLATRNSEVEFFFEPGDKAIEFASSIALAEVHTARQSLQRDSHPLRVSGIRHAKLVFLDRPNESIELAQGEDVEIALESATLHSVSLTSSGIEAYLSGTATRVRRQFDGRSRNQMPTWYDRISGWTAMRAFAAVLTFLIGSNIATFFRRGPTS